MTTNNRLSPYATTVFSEGQFTQVVYHTTCIVKWNLYRIILNSDGWKTVTTKRKMNQASRQFNLGYEVIQKDFDWIVYTKAGEFAYEDGMTIDRNTGIVEYVKE